MARLEEIGVTALTGLAVYTVALFLFGFANWSRSTHIAPRCEARPRDTIYNPHPKDPSQDRGNPWFGWIAWVLKLSYEDMLLGVPGTGTREGGLAGRNLQVNLDNIVMLRLHSFGLRVSTLGVFLCMLVLLPINWTAGCDSDGGSLGEHCDSLTNYDRTTIANIVLDTADVGNQFLNRLSARLYVVVFCSWIMTWYACYELKQEWIDILAMRRFYFLETDHWKRRQEDLKLTSQPPEQKLQQLQQPPSESKSPRHGLLPKVFHKQSTKEEKDHLTRRDPWIPNPEAPDTPPAIALYSVLVGGIPSRPPGQAPPTPTDPESPEALDLNRINLDWQLSVTSAFFDHCVPNQPGFSSSVAAVTILPKASEIASAWKSWYKAAAKLRRLRFIRKQIRERQIELEEEENDVEQGRPRNTLETAPFKLSTQFTSSRSFNNNDKQDGDNADYNREVLGTVMDEEVEDLFLEALNFGPEQTAVYSREFAQSSAPCCPNGCYEEALMEADMEDLLELEQIALEEVQEANKVLEIARSNAVTNARSKEVELRMTPTKDSKESSKSTQNSPKPPCDNESAQKMKHNSRLSLHSALPLDLGSIKKTLGNDAIQGLMKNDTMKNLMGKDSSVPYSAGKRKGHRKTGSMDSMDHFDLEGKLWGEKHSGHGQNISRSNHGNGLKRPSPIKEPSKSAPMADHFIIPSFSSDQGPMNRERSKTEDAKFGIPFEYANQPKASWEEDEGGNVLDNSRHSQIAPLHTCSGKSPEEPTHPFKRQGSRASEPAMNIIPDPAVSPTQPSVPRSNSTGALKVNVDSKLPPLRTDFTSPAGFLENRRHEVYSPVDAWALVDTIAHDGREQGRNDDGKGSRHLQFLSTGNWDVTSLTDFLKIPFTSAKKVLHWTTARSNDAVDLVTGDSTYAVVTFTSRQAAVAARKCLADGRASDRWVQIDTLPIPPLADAAPCDILSCRGCCRPVTLTINDRNKKWRFYCALAALGNIYFFYTIPLTAAAALADSERLSDLFPALENLKQEDGGFMSSESLSSLIAALIWALFFAFCPMLFKMIANFGSNATSIVESEFQALKYFWWFMVVSAFSGSSLQRMVLDGFNDGISVGNQFQDILRSIASTIPTVISASWINWIIVKYSITLPLQYLLQMNTFLFSFFGLKCCTRAVRGGGPGGPLPFRIYVDSGMVLLCLFALAPASPLVAPFAFLYFLVSTPMLRRNVIYLYRPKFDGGGIRWPFIFDMIVSGIFVSQILLCTMMALKKSLGPAFLAAAPFVPTLLFRDSCRNRYLRSFSDVALLQTSLLDGWDTTESTNMEKREDFRRFLVDSHKAAYVPVCIAGNASTDSVLTAEPAVIVPTLEENQLSALGASPQNQVEVQPLTPFQEETCLDRETPSGASANLRARNPRNQFATMRRASTIFAPGTVPGQNPQNRSRRFSSLDLSMISDAGSDLSTKNE